MFIQPASGDDGTALGAALYLQRQRGGTPEVAQMGLPLWGPSYNQSMIEESFMDRDDCMATHYPDFDDLTKDIAKRLVDGQIIAWFQGNMEFGPRALGNRSILADPRQPDMRQRINALVKKREEFRPFAPAVIAEEASKYFAVEPGEESTFAFMLFVTQVRKEWRETLPAITHVDGSARLQTVTKEQNERFWKILHEFGRLTGVPVLLNTSFNVRGQPMICDPKEAITTFLTAKLDALVLGNHLVLPKG